MLAAYLAPYRAQSHDELTRLLMAPVARQVAGPSGKRYQVMIQASWTGRPGGELRVVGGVDHRGWQLFNPVTESFDSLPESTRGGAAPPR